jgi:hypothetical protein
MIDHIEKIKIALGEQMLDCLIMMKKKTHFELPCQFYDKIFFGKDNPSAKDSMQTF